MRHACQWEMHNISSKLPRSLILMDFHFEEQFRSNLLVAIRMQPGNIASALGPSQNPTPRARTRWSRTRSRSRDPKHYDVRANQWWDRRCRQRTLYNSHMSFFRGMLIALVLGTLAAAQQTISFPAEDGGCVCADLYGQGTRAVLLAHGGRFNKKSWREQARAMVSEGFRVLAIDFRGFGCSTGPGQADFDYAPFEKDVIAAVRYLKAHGAKTVSVVGGASATDLPATRRSSPRRVRLIASYFSAQRRTSRQKS